MFPIFSRRRGRLHRLSLRLVTVIGLLVIGLLVQSTDEAIAHPLGNFSVNRYSRLTVENDAVELFYVLDMAEIPTFQAWSGIDTDGDELVSEEERLAYEKLLVSEILENIELEANGRSLPLQLIPHSQTLTFPPGQGDLNTLRLEASFQAALPTETAQWDLSYQDNNDPDRLGWREIVIVTDDAATTTPDVSQALTTYPDDLLQSPLDVRQVDVVVGTAVSPSPTTHPQSPIAQPLAENRFSSDRFSSDHFATLITQPENLGLGALLIVLATAFGLGGAHALSPGHGKTIVAAYLVGSRGTAKHAVFLGLTTTITHTAGVFLFGLLVLFASRFILPEQLYPWLGVASGLLVIWIGFALAYSRWRSLHTQQTHEDAPGYHTHFGIGHTHTPPATDGPLRWRSLLALGVSGGLIPCPSALVVLLSAIALGRIGFGLVLILVFSVGLAAVLTGIGLALVYAGRWFERVPKENGRFAQYGHLSQAIPILSALFITAVGIGITVQAMLQTGIL
ncbi:MAG: sulfite exporter TauE/SafE family protein [Chloroflexota bacterium]